ncbi:MAG: glycine betaine/L-proline ABC transporter ATP-binding protein [Methanomassiliicoccales archaeon]
MIKRLSGYFKLGMHRIREPMQRKQVARAQELIRSDKELPEDEEGNPIKVRVRNVSKIFGDNPQRAVDLMEEGYGKDEILEKTGQVIGVYGVDFNVYEGEIFVLMGLSGSGKSTLIRCINRLIDPTTGEVLIDGDNILELNTDDLVQVRRAKISMVFQRFGLLPHRSVLDNVAYGLEVQDVAEEERMKKAMEATQAVGLKGFEYSRPAQLSGGMQQRVGLARALANDPTILLMDEPFSALDPLIRRDMQDELLDLQERMKKTIIFVTHDLDEALKIGDRIALMNAGRIVQLGTAEEILTEPADDYVADFVAGVDRSKVLTAEAVMINPDPVVTVRQGPRTALVLMRDSNRESIFVVGREREYKGLIESEQALGAAKGKKELTEIMRTDIPTVHPDTQVIDIIPLLVEWDHPLPVVNDDGKLVGMLVPGSVLGALSSEEGMAGGEIGEESEVAQASEALREAKTDEEVS